MIKKKICLLGNEGVGKTSLATRFATDSFSDSYKSTIGVKLFTKSVKTSEGDVTFVVWDLQGGKDFYNQNSYYYNGAFAHIIVADISNKKSVETVVDYYEVSKKHYLSSASYLCFSKNDLERSDFLSTEIQKINKSCQFEQQHYTSAKTGEGIDKLFNDLARKALNC